jgi:PIN domain nuclease of toxin-antitoxin system
VKILLDTNAFLWFISGDAKIPERARQLIENPSNGRFLSIASLWEISIKSSLGRLKVPTPLADLVRDHVQANSIELLAISPEHLDHLLKLPFHHKDPFDRLIIAQAICDEMDLVTSDGQFGAYPVSVQWS